MPNPIELRTLGSEREIDSLKLWVWRILTLLFMANAVASASGELASVAGTVTGAGVVLIGILYALAEEQPETTESPQERSAA